VVTKSERTKKIEAAEVDPDEDILTRGVRSVAKKIGYGASRAGDYVGAGANAVGDYLNPKQEAKDNKPFFERIKSRKQEEDERAQEIRRETRGVKKPLLQKFKSGGMVGSASKRADGCAQRGKTKGRMV